MQTIILTSRNTKNVVGKFVVNETNVERLFDLVAKHDYYGAGEDMIKRIGDVQGFFCDKEEGSEPYKVFFSNNTLMVVFNALSEVVSQSYSNTRMTHTRILQKRRTNKEDRNIGQNMRADVLYNDASIVSLFIATILPLILAGDSLIITEEE